MISSNLSRIDTQLVGKRIVDQRAIENTRIKVISESKEETTSVSESRRKYFTRRKEENVLTSARLYYYS